MEDKKKRSIKSSQMIVYGLFGMIMIFAIYAVINQQAKRNNTVDVNSLEEETENTSQSSQDKPLLAVLTNIDTVAEYIWLQEPVSGQEVVAKYSGGTNILDKYNQVITVSQLSIGEVVDAYISEDNEKLLKLQISSQAWEYTGVNNWSIDNFKKILNIANTKYKYNNNLVVAGNNKILDLFDLHKVDQLTVKGNDKDIYSIIVTKGHGYIQLEDYDDFLGGTAYIGNQDILPIELGMIITAREGIHEIIFEHNKLIGYKTIELVRDESVKVNMGEFKRPLVPEYTETNAINEEGTIDNSIDNNAIEADNGEIAMENNSPSTETNSSAETNSTSGDQNAGEDDMAADYIYVQSPVGVSVYFNAEYKGTAPVKFPKVTGTHYIILIQSGYKTQTHTVEIKDDGKDVYFNFDGLTEE